MSKPVAGQWYVLDGERVWFVGRDYSGVAFVQRRNSLPEIMNDYDIPYLTHLPDCTGWDWQEETFPQYWTANHESIAFIRRDSLTRTVSVWRDGHEGAWLSEWDKVEARSHTRLTETEALALLYKPQPAEDPEEWVVQDRVPARVGIDEFRWSCWQGYHFHVVQDHNIACGMKHGHGHEGSTLSVRCRRKDLPAKPQPAKRKVSVPMWLVTNTENGVFYILQQSTVPKYPESHTVEPAGFMEVEIE